MGLVPTNASGLSVHHQWNSSPASPQSRRFHSRTKEITCPSSPSCSSRRTGTCQQTSGFQSIGRSPTSKAATWRAHPAPPSKPGRLRKMHAPSTTRVFKLPSFSLTDQPFFSATFLCCQCFDLRRFTALTTVCWSSSSMKCAPKLQQPCDNSVASVSRIPLQPEP